MLFKITVMKKNSLITLILFSVIGGLFYSCGNDATKTGVWILELRDIQEADATYTIRQIVPLETREDNLLGEYLKVKFLDNYLFIYDENARNAIHHFDIKGKYRGMVVEVGEGPGMVDNIQDFVPTRAGMEVLVGMGDFSKILVFDNNDVLYKEIELDYQGSSFEKLSNGNYAVSGSYNKPFVENRVALIDPEGKVLNEFLPNDYTNQMLPMSERNFHKEEGKIYFHEVFNPIAYEIKEDSLEARFQFDFGKYAIPEKFWEMEIMQGFEMINKKGYATIYSFWENETAAFFEIYVQQGKEIDNHQVVWDKNSQSATKRTFSKTKESPFYHPIGLVDRQLVFISQAAYILDVASDLPLLKTEGINKDDNPVLVFSPLNHN